jgi:hypothetical protein
MKFDFSKNSFLSVCLFFVTLYILLSFEELFIHKYIMHDVIKIPFLNDVGERHIKHHIATNPDFSIKNNETENICFDSTSAFAVYFITVTIMYLLFHKIISSSIILVSVLVFSVIAWIIWNTLHSYIHFFDGNTLCQDTVVGIPKEYINEDNFYVKWSLDNHRAHHYFKKEEKGNWNVVFPGADYIMGTHNTMPKDYDKKSA